MRAYFCDNCRDWVPSSGKHRCDGCGQSLGDASPKLLSDDSPEARRVIALAAANAKVLAERPRVPPQSQSLSATSQESRYNSPPTTGGVQMAHCSKCGTRSVEGAGFCHACGAPIVSAQAADQSLEDVYARLRGLVGEVATQRELIAAHTEILSTQGDDIHGCETILASSNVYHADFWPRSLAIWGHVLVPGAILGVAIYLLTFAFVAAR